MELFIYNKNLKERARELRNKSTLSEVVLWNYLKKRQINNLQFLRQKIISNYIVDFYCPLLKLAIEIDGSSHDLKEEYDEFRQKELENLGIRFLRFTNEDVMGDIKIVVKEIQKKTSLGLRPLPS